MRRNPDRTDRLIVQMFDPLTPAPGGIDTCLRGILRYKDAEETISIVGVDGRTDSGGSRVGRWEQHLIEGRKVAFLAVCQLDPGNQIRRRPHSLHLALGVLRYRRRMPSTRTVQTHRADIGALARLLWPSASQTYFIHTQESGLLGQRSDSFWRHAAAGHRWIERMVVRGADRIRVFNPDYIQTIRSWNPVARASPTWWDPELIEPRHPDNDSRAVIWVGRLEDPKDPELALRAMAVLRASHPDEPWHLTMVGDGNLRERLTALRTGLGLEDRVTFTGRLSPKDVTTARARASLLLMTSVAGYEGYPRVLVEGLATGLPAVVTEGSDTGGLIRDGVSGFTVGRSPEALADALRAAVALRAEDARAAVADLSGPRVVEALYAD